MGQAAQKVAERWPILLLKVPAGHALHNVAPTALEKVPTGQGEQVLAPALEKVPVSHAKHEVTETAESALFAVPAGHAVQATLPVVSA